ncbi:MAG TPA: DUF1549 domain-containing protein, partial [Pirellulales bacterium]|nr:DUF1549 domain-containing protein [Pirellulales bacterium]
MKRSLAAVALLLLAWSTAMLRAADILPPVSERFAPEKTDEAPDFRHHVLPLMGRLGCNGRACHGSFQGQGGFRLSLFGYDAQMDYDALMKGDHPRVDPKNVDKSLFLLKPSKQVDHEGGRRMAVDSWQYRLIRRWIQAGAKPVPPKQADFDHLEITPPEIVFANRDEHRALRVVAVWKDGVREDVTPICRFRSNDDGICRIDAEGVVTSVAQGDTDVVAFYDNGVQPVPVILPVSKQVGDQYPAVAAPTKIDQLILEKLRKVGIVPSEVAGDAEFLRRLSLDMTGTLPQPPEVAAFLADTSSDKRAKKIDELLERPAYAAWWATRFSDWTGNNSAQLQQIFQNGGVDGAMISAQWYSWLFDRLQKNVDYDKIVQNILVSQSREPGESYRDYCAKMLRLSQGDPSEFAKNETMPYYWARQNFRKPDEAVVGFCYTFLGLQIQCAQCHKHPFDQWSKRDFDKFAGFFTRIGVGVKPDGWEDYAELSKDADIGKGLNGKALRQKLEELIKAGKSLPQREVYVGYKPGEKPPRLPKGDKAIRGVPPPPVGAATASVLGGPSVDLKTVEDPRQTLMDWMLHDPSRYFARSIVD